MQCQPMSGGALMPTNGYHSPTPQETKNAGLLMCSPTSSLDGFLHSPAPRPEPSFKDDTRFQYVLAAATSIATKQNEETLTYLNQGQPYEIKLKKLGDLSHYKGKLLKSVIKICFHERRLQYMEREQIAQWHAERPGDRIIELDVPLSYGVTRVEQPSSLNALNVYWDPTKDVGVYIKVFKLKGADRKHKQDREKVMRRPRPHLDHYQPGCDATVLTTLSNDALMPPPSLVAASPPYSPQLW
ncbi:hypothetical protein evm_002265 [Chilo suppressalis]|nr:hypothetical protein evm_002265 [Chilo suppressalis]